MKKIVIIGAGNVGAHCASSILQRNTPAAIYLVDKNEAFEQAQVLDLRDAMLFHPFGKVFQANPGDEVLHNADIIIITAGAKQRPGETRCDLLGRNIRILQEIKSYLTPLNPNAIVILITNPVDILTQSASEIFSLPHGQVFGTGTLLDTSRLRWRLAERFSINVRNTHGIVMGEHGDSEFVAWSTVSQAEKLSPSEKATLEAEVRDAAYKIIEGKGATYFGIGAVCAEFVQHIFSDSKAVLPASVPLKGEYGIEGIALGVPAIIGEKGIEKVIELPLTKEEKAKLHRSAEKLKTLFQQCPH